MGRKTTPHYDVKMIYVLAYGTEWVVGLVWDRIRDKSRRGTDIIYLGMLTSAILG